MIHEDRALLRTMVQDMETADTVYRPGNYWQVYFDRFYPVLLREGLARFRASGDRTYRSMGVSGKPFLLQNGLRPYWFRELPTLKRVVLSACDLLGIYRKINTLTTDSLQQTFEAFQQAYFQLALETDPSQEILRICDSREGEPMDYFHPDAYPDLGYTISFLRCFREY